MSGAIAAIGACSEVGRSTMLGTAVLGMGASQIMKSIMQVQSYQSLILSNLHSQA